MNPINNIWNYNYIQQQAQQQYHQEQAFQVADSARKLKNFLDSVDHVALEYQGALTAECCAVLLDYAHKHNLL